MKLLCVLLFIICFGVFPAWVLTHKPSALENAKRQSHYTARDWALLHYNKTPSKKKIIGELIPRIANYVFYYDSVYVAQIPPALENTSTTYTVIADTTGEMFLIFVFFDEKKEFTTPRGLNYDPEGEDRIQYLCSDYIPTRR